MAHLPDGNVRINQFEVLDERLKPDNTIAVAEKAERLAFYLTTNSVLCPRISCRNSYDGGWSLKGIANSQVIKS